MMDINISESRRKYMLYMKFTCLLPLRTLGYNCCHPQKHVYNKIRALKKIMMVFRVFNDKYTKFQENCTILKLLVINGLINHFTSSFLCFMQMSCLCAILLKHLMEKLLDLIAFKDRYEKNSIIVRLYQ